MIWPERRKADDAEYQEHCGADLDAETSRRLSPTLIEGSPKAVAAHGLEALPKADDGGVDEHHKAVHNGHSRDGRVPIGMGHDVHNDGGRAGYALAPKGGKAAVDDLPVDEQPGLKVFDADGDAVVAEIAHAHQDAEADKLGDCLWPGRLPQSPISKPKMRMGSNPMLIKPPAVMPNMAKKAFPWKRRRLFRIKEQIMKGAARKI